MPREHFNDVPGDIVGSIADDLPGGLGTRDPDMSDDAMIDELVDNDVVSPFSGRIAAFTNQGGGATTGTGYAHAADSGASVDPADLLEGEEGHPGAALGVTGEDRQER